MDPPKYITLIAERAGSDPDQLPQEKIDEKTPELFRHENIHYIINGFVGVDSIIVLLFYNAGGMFNHMAFTMKLKSVSMVQEIFGSMANFLFDFISYGYDALFHRGAYVPFYTNVKELVGRLFRNIMRSLWGYKIPPFANLTALKKVVHEISVRMVHDLMDH